MATLMQDSKNDCQRVCIKRPPKLGTRMRAVAWGWVSLVRPRMFSRTASERFGCHRVGHRPHWDSSAVHSVGNDRAFPIGCEHASIRPLLLSKRQHRRTAW